MTKWFAKSLPAAGLAILLVPTMAGCPSDDDDDDGGPAPARPVSTSVDFGCRSIGTMIQDTLTISNNGSVDIEIDEIRLGGFDPTKVDVSVDPNRMVMIPPMSSVDIDVMVDCLDEVPVRAVASLHQGGLITAVATIFGQCTDYTSPVTFNGMVSGCTGGGMDGAVSFTLSCDPGTLDILTDVQTYPAHCGCDTQSLDGALQANGDFDLTLTSGTQSCQVTGIVSGPGMYNITTSSQDVSCMIDCSGMANR